MQDAGGPAAEIWPLAVSQQRRRPVSSAASTRTPVCVVNASATSWACAQRFRHADGTHTAIALEVRNAVR